MPVFQPNVPTGTVPLDQDYLNLQGNNQQLNISFGVDHVPFSDTSGIPPTGISGAHKSLHMVPFSTEASNPPNNQPPILPAAVTGLGEVICVKRNDGIAIDTSMFFQTSGGLIQEMSRNFTPVKANNGYTFLPGGLILQWGRLTQAFSGGDTGAITFATSNIDFPNNCFSVSLQGGYTGSINGAASFSVRTSSISTTGFQWTLNTNSGAVNSMLWFALGN